MSAGKYTVSSYDNWEFPGTSSLIDAGSFDSADEAIACAQTVVNRSLSEHAKPGMCADDLMSFYSIYGEVPVIGNDEGLEFAPYAYARKRIRDLTGEASAILGNQRSLRTDE